MNTENEIKLICDKSPQIMKLFLKLNDHENMDIFQIKWMYKIWSKNKNSFKKYFVNYNQIKTLKDFVFLIKKICNEVYSVKNQKESLIHYLKAQNKEYKELNDQILVEIESWEETQLLGSENWCIVRSQRDYNGYMETHDKQFIVFKYNEDDTLKDYYGFMIKDGVFSEGFNRQNNKITFSSDDIVKQFKRYRSRTINSVNDIWKSPIFNTLKFNKHSFNFRYYGIMMYSYLFSVCGTDYTFNVVSVVISIALIITTLFMFEQRFGTMKFLSSQASKRKEFECARIAGVENIEGEKQAIDSEWKSRVDLKQEYTAFSIILFIAGSISPVLFLLFS